ncbi:armadillo-like helical domain containing protein 1 [Mauremys reevesii]|uniref:armadillo-like helical domain containing protein 1 n=1 Tax=Mauremys reevesii TaxID=260615 RepID=UPI00193ED7E2|nr:armadillo-like helical domain containing protein 1 [Mauremys reevesii]
MFPHSDPATLHLPEPLSVYVQQAAAAKTIGILAQDSTKLAEEMIQLRVVHGLMCAMGNQDHTTCQRQASISLEYFVRTFPIVEEHVRKATGETLFQLFMVNGLLYLPGLVTGLEHGSILQG